MKGQDRAMKFVLAFYGTRGDVEPGVAVGRELLRRGHDVRMAVSPDLVGFAEAAGLAAVGYGPDVQAWLESTRNFWAYFFRNFWRIRDVLAFLRESREPGTRCWGEMSTMLTSLTGRRRPAVDRLELRGACRQCRGVSRHSVGHAALVPDPGQRPAHSDSAQAVDPLGDEGVRVVRLARGQEGRGFATS